MRPPVSVRRDQYYPKEEGPLNLDFSAGMFLPSLQLLEAIA
jgi:hypothetical protein